MRVSFQGKRFDINGTELAETLYGAGRVKNPQERTNQMALRVSPEFLKALEEAEAGDAGASERWTPEPGDFIAGELTDCREVDTDNGDATVITVNDHKLGPVDLFLNVVLKQVWEKKKPVVGEIIGIKYLGEQESQSGRTYKNYKVMLQRENAAQPTLSGTTSKSTETVDDDPFADE